jgi:hypothetical protein
VSPRAGVCTHDVGPPAAGGDPPSPSARAGQAASPPICAYPRCRGLFWEGACPRAPGYAPTTLVYPRLAGTPALPFAHTPGAGGCFGRARVPARRGMHPRRWSTCGWRGRQPSHLRVPPAAFLCPDRRDEDVASTQTIQSRGEGKSYALECGSLLPLSLSLRCEPSIGPKAAASCRSPKDAPRIVPCD